MGQPFSEEYFPFTDPFRVLMVGLCGSGKTSLLYRMKHSKSPPAAPAHTETFNLSRIVVEEEDQGGGGGGASVELAVWDMNVGKGAGFVMARHHYANSKGVIFVIDCSESRRLSEAIDCLAEEVMGIRQLTGLPLVVLCHKSDLARRTADVIKTGHIEDRLREERFSAAGNVLGVFATSSFESSGVATALRALASAIVAGEMSKRRVKAVERLEYEARMRRAQSDAEQAVRDEVLQECEIEPA